MVIVNDIQICKWILRWKKSIHRGVACFSKYNDFPFDVLLFKIQKSTPNFPILTQQTHTNIKCKIIAISIRKIFITIQLLLLLLKLRRETYYSVVLSKNYSPLSAFACLIYHSKIINISIKKRKKTFMQIKCKIKIKYSHFISARSIKSIFWIVAPLSVQPAGIEYAICCREEPVVVSLSSRESASGSRLRDRVIDRAG